VGKYIRWRRKIRISPQGKSLALFYMQYFDDASGFRLGNPFTVMHEINTRNANTAAGRIFDIKNYGSSIKTSHQTKILLIFFNGLAALPVKLFINTGYREV
jgi:hypothetical protein